MSLLSVLTHFSVIRAQNHLGHEFLFGLCVVYITFFVWSEAFWGLWCSFVCHMAWAGGAGFSFGSVYRFLSSSVATELKLDLSRVDQVVKADNGK